MVCVLQITSVMSSAENIATKINPCFDSSVEGKCTIIVYSGFFLSVHKTCF